MGELTNRNKRIAETIIAQLGGNRFVAMTGAKNFVYGEAEVTFKIPQTNAISHVRVSLDEARDTYRMVFSTRTGRAKAEHADVYAEDLQRIFTSETGLYTHL